MGLGRRNMQCTSGVDWALMLGQRTCENTRRKNPISILRAIAVRVAVPIRPLAPGGRVSETWVGRWW